MQAVHRSVKGGGITFRCWFLSCLLCVAVSALPRSLEQIADKYWSLGVAEQLGASQRQPVRSQGSVPSWLSGLYVLGGPSQFKVGKRRLNHLFDGFARISTFDFNGSNMMLFSSRMTDSGWYNDSMKAGDITAQFTMNATTPPRLSDRVPMLNAVAPNDNNIVIPMKMNNKTYWYLSDSETRLQWDPQTLRISRELHASKPMHASDYSGDAEPAGYMCTIGTAHGLFDVTGDLINQMGCSPSNPLSSKPDLVVVYRIKRAEPSRRIKIIQFEPHGSASYMHSYGLSADYAVFVEQPIGFDMVAMMEGKTMIEGMPVNYSRSTYFHIVALNGSSAVITKEAPMSFCFNHVANMVQLQGKLQLDIFEVFRSGHLFGGGSFDIWLNKTRRDREINFEAMRFMIPLAQEEPIVVKGITGRNVTERCSGALCDQIRLPIINRRFQGKPYCLIYGIQTKFGGGPFASQGNVRVNVCTSKVDPLPDHSPGQYPHELLFVPNPEGTEEDDGVLIGHVLDGVANESFVQVVNASTLKRVAKFVLPLRLGEMIHGNWFARE